jgi:hypothetical protein
VLHDRHTLRVAVGNLRTEREHVDSLWELIGRSYDELARET